MDDDTMNFFFTFMKVPSCILLVKYGFYLIQDI